MTALIYSFTCDLMDAISILKMVTCDFQDWKSSHVTIRNLLKIFKMVADQWW